MSLFDFFFGGSREETTPLVENDSLVITTDDEAIVVEADSECRMCGCVLSSGQVDVCSPCSARLSRHGRRQEAIHHHW